MYEWIWKIFCDRLESEVRALGNRDLRVRDDGASQKSVHVRQPHIEASQSLRFAGLRK